MKNVIILQYHYDIRYGFFGIILLQPVECRGKPDKIKCDAFILYLEGLRVSVNRWFLKVSHVAVFNWIKGFIKKLEDFRNSGDIEVVEIDEKNYKKRLIDIIKNKHKARLLSKQSRHRIV